ncbi:hypothetical protein SAMN02745866_04188 [Alteromonadaceae bacterium Bs31]|nr:hypothetical protein SAMN02745866_04188 [Alteromonadaceae bacterium Bs31]
MDWFGLLIEAFYEMMEAESDQIVKAMLEHESGWDYEEGRRFFFNGLQSEWGM